MTDWAHLSHAYGSAEDLPVLLEQSALANSLTYLFGNATCPTCGVTLAVAECRA